MIKLDELKPIIEPHLGDNAADVIESIIAIDTYNTEGFTQADIDDINAKWNERFKKAFLHGVDNSAPTDDKSVEQTAEQTEDQNVPLTYDALFEEVTE